MAVNKIMKVASVPVLFGAIVLTFALKPNSANRSKAEGEPVPAVVPYAPDAFETDAPSGLSVSVTSSTLTSKAHSFTVSFSTGGKGYTDNNRVVTLGVNTSDPNYHFIEERDDTTITSTEQAKWINFDNFKRENFDSIPNIEGYVYSFNVRSNRTTWAIPRRLYRNGLYSITPSTIRDNSVDFSSLIASKKIDLFIPNNIEHIYENSFVNLESAADRVTIHLEVDEATAEANFATNWHHGASVVYGEDFSNPDLIEKFKEIKGDGFDIADEVEPALDSEGNQQFINIDGEEKLIEKAAVDGLTIEKYPLVYKSSAGANDVGDPNINLYLGYNQNGKNEPLYLGYKYIGSAEQRYTEFNLNKVFMSVGKAISSFNTVAYVDVPVNANEKIDLDSLTIHNIHDSKVDPQVGFTIDEEKSYRITPSRSFISTLDIGEFIDFKYKGVSEFASYFSISTDIKVTNVDLYKTLKTSVYNQYKKNIDSNNISIRYRVSSLSMGNYLLNYGDGKVFNEPITTPVNQYVLGNGDNSLSFILDKTYIKDFKSSDIKSFSFVGLYVTIDLYGQNGPIARSAVTTRFGYVSIIDYSDSVSVFDINLLLIIVALSYAGLYILTSVGYFFFCKEKYKNDEFRRLKPKSFITKGVLGLFGSLTVLIALLFVIFRCTLFNNAIVVFNPFDPFIIIFVIASVLIIGYFIKFIVVTTKANNHVRKTKKLKLDQDVVEDGTK